MLETSARLLKLLSLLQSRRDWTGPRLAERLEVTTRTVRNDVERLRTLGYPVEATPGVAGGYRLGIGASMPPLLLDDDEAVAVAIGLRTASSGTVTGMAEATVRALAKLEQMLPARLRHRLASLAEATVSLPAKGPRVRPETLTAIAAATRDHQRLRFDYERHDGTSSVRLTEPHRLVHNGQRWYLVGWDVERRDWRTFRVDRITPQVPTGPRFVPRDPPEGDLVGYVSRGLGTATWRYRARVTVHAPASAIQDRMPAGIEVTPAGPRRCYVDVGSDNAAMLAFYVGMIGEDFSIDPAEAPELADELLRLADRYTNAVGRPSV
jgi:predicted DNA-binding transcriptional regulator YafY